MKVAFIYKWMQFHTIQIHQIGIPVFPKQQLLIADCQFDDLQSYAQGKAPAA